MQPVDFSVWQAGRSRDRARGCSRDCGRDDAGDDAGDDAEIDRRLSVAGSRRDVADALVHPRQLVSS